jgi:hypothetical protein
MAHLRFLVSAAALAWGLSCLNSSASTVDALRSYVGFKIVAVKTIEKSVSTKDGSSKEEFEGCDFDRVIVFTDNTFVKCNSYRYHYAYRPEAVILTDGFRWVMIVDDDEYDVNP